MTRLPLIACALLLAACSTPEIRVAAPVASTVQEASATISIRYSSVEVRAATMPAYAASEEIFVEGADGTLSPLGPLWSDEPSRAVTLALSRNLASITGRLVAPEPWPFRDAPAATLDLRIEDFYVTSAGAFRIAGQYFVAPAGRGRDIARSFAIEVPVGGESALADLASAQSDAIGELTFRVARDGLN